MRQKPVILIGPHAVWRLNNDLWLTEEVALLKVEVHMCLILCLVKSSVLAYL